MELTPDQLGDIRADIGDTGATPAFSDAELQRLYERAGDDWDLLKYLAYNQLVSVAAKRVDYTANMSEEKASQVFTHLKQLRDDLSKRLGLNAPVVVVGSLDLGLDGDGFGDESSYA